MLKWILGRFSICLSNQQCRGWTSDRPTLHWWWKKGRKIVLILGHPALWQKNSDSRHFWSRCVRAGVTVQVVGLNVVHEIKGEKSLSFPFESPLPRLTLISALWLFYFYISLTLPPLLCCCPARQQRWQHLHLWLLLQLIRAQQRMTGTYCTWLSCLLL